MINVVLRKFDLYFIQLTAIKQKDCFHVSVPEVDLMVITTLEVVRLEMVTPAEYVSPSPDQTKGNGLPVTVGDEENALVKVMV